MRMGANACWPAAGVPPAARSCGACVSARADVLLLPPGETPTVEHAELAFFAATVTGIRPEEIRLGDLVEYLRSGATRGRDLAALCRPLTRRRRGEVTASHAAID